MKKCIPLLALLMVTVLLTGCLGFGSNKEPEPTGPPTFPSEPGDDRFVGDFEIEVTGAVTEPSSNGKDVFLIVSVSYTNNSKDNAIFKNHLEVAVFQDGVMLDQKNPVLQLFDSGASGKTIRPGATLEVELAYKPENLMSLVEVEVFLKGNYYVDAKADNKERADYYGAIMEIGGGQVSNTAETIAAERQVIIDEWEAEQERLAAEVAEAEADGD